MKYRLKFSVSAMQFTSQNGVEMARFIGFDGQEMDKIESNIANGFLPPELLIMATPAGEQLLQPGDWVVRNHRSELFRMTDDEFLMTYEAVP